uniref:DUF4065 domain-containing protein n=1 Tax=Caenorhabditis tropicalis TaxID=1561998 RepID=A0A1I7UYM4_9PELO
MEQPISSCLNKNILKGYLYCLFNQGLSACQSNKALIQFTRTRVFRLPEVRKLFESYKNGKFDMKIQDYEVLAENFQFYDQGVANMMSVVSRMETYSNYADLKLLTRDKLYPVECFKERGPGNTIKREFYQKDCLLGFILCLKVKNSVETDEKAYEKLKEVTGGEEKMSLEEIKEFSGRIDRGEYIEQKHDQRLWDAIRLPEVMSKIVDFADIGTRLVFASFSLLFMIENSKT